MDAQIGRAVHEPALELAVRERLVETEHERVEPERRPLQHVRELGRERAADRADEPLVVGYGRDVQGDDPSRRQVLANEPEELRVAR